MSGDNKHAFVVKLTYASGSPQHLFVADEREAQGIRYEIEFALRANIKAVNLIDGRTLLSTVDLRRVDLIPKSIEISDEAWLG